VSPNSLVPFHPSVLPAFNFLFEAQPEPSWGPERVLVYRTKQTADLSWCQLCGRNCLAPMHRQHGFAWRDSEISAWTTAFGTESAKTYREEEWQGLEPDSSVPTHYTPLPPRVDSEPRWRTSTPTFEFFIDLNTPLPSPFREPIKFCYFDHTPDCQNKISPNDLLDSYDRPLNVRACPHCHGRLRRGESAPNNWCTPMHWDVATQEVFGGRPIPRPSRLVIEDGVRKVEGDWDGWVAPELKSWSTSQKSHFLDQNYFEPARMQGGAVRNNKSIFRVLPDESNTPQISRSYTSEIDEGEKLTKPIVCLRMDVDPGDRALEEGLDESDESDTKRHYRIDPWKPMHFVFENDGEVFRVWWLSIGKAKVTTDTARRREEYKSGSKTMDARLVLLRDAVLSQESLRELQAEWNKILKEEYDLPELKIGTRETRAISMTRQTTKGRTIRVEHDSTSGVKVNTLRQREIRRMRQAEKKTDPPPDELLNKYVNKMSPSDADPICQGGCFALVPLHHLELKRLGPYSAAVSEIFDALELERRKSVRSGLKYERKAARRKGLSNEELQERIDRRRTRIDHAFDHAEVFRRPHCIDHG
jgi:hypothetical protein